MRQVTIFDKNFKLFISYNKIYEAVKKIAGAINTDYNNAEPPVFISVLNGSFMFTADLFKELDISAAISFIKLASYKNEKSSGKVTEIIGLNEELTGKHVLILEDILDTGITLDYLCKNILKKKPASLKIAALLFKKEALKKDIKPDYFGVEVPNRFLIGYGLDYKGLGRNYKDLYVCLDG